MMTLQISRLTYYPLKSAQGISVETAALQARGLEYDRRWMLVDVHGDFLTQRTHPQMAQLQARVVETGLQIAGPEGDSILAQPRGKEWIPVTVWGDRLQAAACSVEVDQWLSNFLGEACRLVYMPDSVMREVDPDYRSGEGDIVSFADGFPVLVVTEASLKILNRSLEHRVPMNRFRPNIVISGSEAFAEDTWQAIETDTIRLNIVKPCSRCQITTIDQVTGQRPDRHEPLKTLKQMHAWQGQIFFGQNAIPVKTGQIAVGDPVHAIFKT